MGGAVKNAALDQPGGLMRRTAMRDATLAGVPIVEGDKVVMYYGSANRDPDAFGPTAGLLDLARSPNDHVAFGGGGPHFCLGAHIARVEIRAAARAAYLVGRRRRPRAPSGSRRRSSPGRSTYRSGSAPLRERRGRGVGLLYAYPRAAGRQLDGHVCGVEEQRASVGRGLHPEAVDDVAGGEDPGLSEAEQLPIGDAAVLVVVHELDHDVRRCDLDALGVDVRLPVLPALEAADAGIPE